MKKYSIIPISFLILGIIFSCGVSESNNGIIDIESAILKVIAADDSTYGIEGLADIEDEDYSLGKAPDSDQSDGSFSITMRDSNYVWRFARRGMAVERVVTVEVEDDSSAQALISHHITGTFYVKQFARVWTSLDTWERGDSIRFSEKPIDMGATRRVAFRKRLDDAGETHWKPVAMTLLSGHSGESLDIEALEWVAEDSTLVWTDFGNVVYSRRNPLLLSQMGVNHMNVVVSNDADGEMEKVIGRLGYNPRVGNPDSRSRFHFFFVETLDTGDKVYSRRIIPNRLHRRHFKGFVEVIDYRTLFDHNYENYSSATVGFIYTTREHIRP